MGLHVFTDYLEVEALPELQQALPAAEAALWELASEFQYLLNYCIIFWREAIGFEDCRTLLSEKFVRSYECLHNRSRQQSFLCPMQPKMVCFLEIVICFILTNRSRHTFKRTPNCSVDILEAGIETMISREPRVGRMV